MRSMTGFGRGDAERGGITVTVELRSVNHRFLDLGFRMPRQMNFVEDDLRKALQTDFARGHIDLFLTYRNARDDAREAQVDRGLVAAYMRAAAEMNELGVPGKLELTDLLRMPDAVRLSEKEESQDELRAIALDAYAAAAAQMKRARGEEGERLKVDLLARLDIIAEKRAAIAEREPVVVNDYAARLRERVTQLLDGVQADEARLVQEVAIFADRASITEELTRLAAHIESLRELMAQDIVMGRRLDFIVQELNREANTIGSKASDLAITGLVVDIKAEIEKIREQVQNIE